MCLNPIRCPYKKKEICTQTYIKEEWHMTIEAEPSDVSTSQGMPRIDGNHESEEDT